MKAMIALMLLAFPSLANIVDSTYSVTPPVSATNCPAIQPGIEFPCYYVAIGEYTDTYYFSAAGAAYAFEVTGSHWRRCTVSGHRICYTESNDILAATIVDLASGVTVLELQNTAEDDWTGSVDLSPGDYAILISGVVGGNRPGVYGYSISYATAPAVIPNDPTPIIVDGQRQ